MPTPSATRVAADGVSRGAEKGDAQHSKQLLLMTVSIPVVTAAMVRVFVPTTHLAANLSSLEIRSVNVRVGKSFIHGL